MQNKYLYFLKNYFYIFSFTYAVILLTKFIFFFYLQGNYSTISLLNAIYAIFMGYKFDFATSAIIAFLATFFDFHKKSLSFLGSLLISFVFLLQISDIMYFYESSRHIGYEINDALTDAFGLSMTAISQHPKLCLLALILLILILYTTKIVFSKNLKTINFNKFYIFKKNNYYSNYNIFY